MRVRIKKPSNWDRLGQKYAEEARRVVTTKLLAALDAMQESILQTPVYTGRTLVNYHWSVGSPVEQFRRPVPRPKLPGKTSDLPIGAEPRREAQQIIVEFEFAQARDAAQKNPYQHFFLTNTSPNFLDVEYGTYRAGARTPPGGMTRRGESLVNTILGAPRG